MSVSDEHQEFYDNLGQWVETQKKNYSNLSALLNEGARAYWSAPTFYPSGTTPTTTQASARQVNAQQHSPRPPVHRYRRFQLAPLHTRLLAEVVDLVLMYLLKVALLRLIGGQALFSQFMGFLPNDILNSLPGYRFMRIFYSWAFIISPEDDLDFYVQVLKTYEEFIRPLHSDALLLSNVLWLFLRVVSEIFLLSHPMLGFGPGGCTIGKYLFNLRVVSCRSLIRQADSVEVSPAGDPGLLR
ncbi:unnamed protein product [Dibothriocephalus latus]|uniref:RDD domain-containing protein n=1 Tax=Dibothriocephalus latus TaxID=60516 RepID=A0A3P7LNP7_DIBLA|nr:unnamed protein product [Dibothriocephalus latus]